MEEIGWDIVKQSIPLDKSHYMRLGLLALKNDEEPTLAAFLQSQENLSDDLLALGTAVHNYSSSDEIHVDESATLLRFLRYYSWSNNDNKHFIMSGTLPSRDITNNPDLVHWPQSQLLDLDNGTSQWASAAALCGSPERVKNPPYKLAQTYAIIEVWNNSSNRDTLWTPTKDETITRQAEAFLEIKIRNKPDFQPEQAEDYPFAYVFGYISQIEGLERWPSLLGHESNRILETTAMLQLAEKGLPITSRDHRVVQAIAMWAATEGVELVFTNPDCVKKSWPKFWDIV